jgi:hypothetical protein
MSLLSYFHFFMPLSFTSISICVSLFKTLFCLCLCLTFCHYLCVTGTFFLFVVSNYFFFLLEFHTFTSVCLFLVYVVIYLSVFLLLLLLKGSFLSDFSFLSISSFKSNFCHDTHLSEQERVLLGWKVGGERKKRKL